MNASQSLATLVALGLSCAASAGGPEVSLSPQERLGKSIFFDKNLSLHRNQSCATCHDPQVGWTGPKRAINDRGAVYPGSVPTRFGNRKPPSAAYATPSPILDLVEESDGEGTESLFVGGNFWDGRATGEKLGNPAADQAQGPFLNPVEQALPDAACVVYRVCTGKYAGDLLAVSPDACDIAFPSKLDTACSKSGKAIHLPTGEREKVQATYDTIARAVAAYEGSAEVNAYSSRYDAYLAGKAQLSATEKDGLELFQGKGKCANCHVLDRGPNGEPPLLTDFTFDNLGVPGNPENPWYRMPTAYNPEGRHWIDKGLGGFLATRTDYQSLAAENTGKHRVPTLRNVDLGARGKGFVKAYMHNGYFKSLKSVVHFYNTRDVKPACPSALTTEADALAAGCWPAPEVAANVNTDELGDLGLTPAEEDAIVAFMKTLNDGYVPPRR
jgi:cytochrome c peroxidase